MMTMFWPLLYKKNGITYKLDINTKGRGGLWEIYIVHSGWHVTFGPTPARALHNAGLKLENAVR